MSLSTSRVGMLNKTIIKGKYVTHLLGILNRMGVKLYHESESKCTSLKTVGWAPNAKHLPTTQAHKLAEMANNIRI